jgi:hypothetical protein
LIRWIRPHKRRKALEKTLDRKGKTKSSKGKSRK